jgi:hypothetical protein
VSQPVVWNYVQSCCGKKAAVATIPSAIKKSGAQIFRDAGWFVPENYFKIGIFYAQKDNFVVNAAYGAVQLHVKCAGDNCQELTKKFEELISKAI